MTIKKWLPLFSLFFLILVTITIYFPGLKGGFIFDDFSNLGEMNQYGDMSQWGNAKKFVMNGIAGPTGRPISLLTFVPQAEAWLSGDAYSFKVVNLLIHLICGVLLYFATRLVLVAYGELKNNKIQYVAIVIAGIWMLHPLMLSTTLYVIQRMAQLPLLFSLLAIIGYLKGRSYINIHNIRAYLFMSLSIGLGTLCATFSKENGALLPLLILVIEFCNPVKENRPLWQWRAIFLWLPSIVIIIALIKHIDFSDNLWPNRNFNQVERLLTECRVVVNYLIQLYIPRIEGYGLFQDGYLVSKNLTTPATTLYSLMFLSVLFIGALIVRKKTPLISMAVLFFFAAHLMESTVIGLELYFEHRNYVASIFIFLPLALGLYWLSSHIKPILIIFLTALILVFLSFLTFQRAILWSDNIKLMLYWAQNSPKSARAQSVQAAILFKEGQTGQAKNTLETATKEIPNDGMLIYQLLQLKIVEQSVKKEDFLSTLSTIKSHKANPQAIIGLRDLVSESIKHSNIIEKYEVELLQIINETLKNSTYGINPDFNKLAYFLKGQIALAAHNPEEAYKYYLMSLQASKDVEDGMYMSTLLGNQGYLVPALKLLKATEEVYKMQPKKLLKKPKAFYDNWLKRTKDDMQKDLLSMHRIS